jgi:hypothetical protein
MKKLELIKIIKEEISSVLNEGMAESLANTVRLYNVRFKKGTEFESGVDEILKQMQENGVTSEVVLQFAALFPRNSFKLDFIRNGQLAAKVKASYINDTSKKVKQAEILKSFVDHLDNFYGTKWNGKF